MIMLITVLINIYSVKFAKWISNYLAAFKIAFILIMIGIGLYNLICLDLVQNFENVFNGTSTDLSSYSIALYSGMWAYEDQW